MTDTKDVDYIQLWFYRVEVRVLGRYKLYDLINRTQKHTPYFFVFVQKCCSCKKVRIYSWLSKTRVLWASGHEKSFEYEINFGQALGTKSLLPAVIEN